MGQFKNIEFLKLVGSRIESIRKSKNLTHEILAERMDLNDVRQIGRVINAETNFSTSEIYRFSMALGVQPKELFDFEIDLKTDFNKTSE
ncbi:Helix-turn-helix protein [Belliella baltica DSM 15883]|uniref:Helix-turn-helix protein n=1 Tax=Belliella baltica (strain DSM 15883 / CIP 108006 / LMG 21964 / BA134) TaxID=866536 RepID=I3Z782_BELBD|nr:helix-turn-helix transcriptional regulator [Belliella baltica]AFL85100.1 Helix-turn-helix protein [Belliella baltica DSM 15883]